MLKLLFVLLAAVILNSSAFSQDCLSRTKEVKPVYSAQIKTLYDKKLAEAFVEFDKSNGDADSVIWLGRRTAYLGNYKDAIRLFTRGIGKYPRDARLYRHRGHRYITRRCFDEAIKDLETAARLVKGKPDAVEPDGLPNAQNIPTSTLQSNIWYHLGLAYYLKGDFKKALAAYQECEKVSKNPDMLVATKHWMYMTLRRLGDKAAADAAISDIGDALEIIENDDYYSLIKLYQGKLKPEVLLTSKGSKTDSLSNASLGYGIGNWNLYNGRREEAIKTFEQITAGDQWSSFGYIAAEADLAR
ncbi:MAG: tetratricopeptide repeat protein [Pyrinomonadaceae bacterium]